MGLIKKTSAVFELLTAIQKCIWDHKNPFSIVHIRAHTGLPGPLTEGNAIADKFTQTVFAFLTSSPVQLAQDIHNKFHVNAMTLQHKFGFTREQAREIALQCGHCVSLLPQQSIGVNPRGLKPLIIWQMDVTHVLEFGTLKYVYVSIDTYSGVIFASAHAGEKAQHVISHCLQAFAAWAFQNNIKQIMVLLILPKNS